MAFPSARKPAVLGSEGSMYANWKEWRKDFLRYLRTIGANEWPTDQKAGLLRDWIGPVGGRVLKDFPPEVSEDLDKLMEHFSDYFGSRETEAHRRYIFFSSARQDTKTIDQYIYTLKMRAKECNFGDQMESLVRDKIILDVNDKKLRKHLLGEPNLNLNQTIELWKKFEAAEKVTPLRSKSFLNTVNKPEHKPSSGNLERNANSETSSCEKCGTRHNPRHCPAYGQKCENCGMVNHLTELCNKPSTSNTNIRNEDVRSDLDSNLKEVPKYFNAGPFTQIRGLNKKNVYE